MCKAVSVTFTHLTNQKLEMPLFWYKRVTSALVPVTFSDVTTSVVSSTCCSELGVLCTQGIVPIHTFDELHQHLPTSLHYTQVFSVATLTW